MKNYLPLLLLLFTLSISAPAFAAPGYEGKITNLRITRSISDVLLGDTVKKADPKKTVKSKKRKKKKDTLQNLTSDMPALKIFVDGLETIARGIARIFE